MFTFQDGGKTLTVSIGNRTDASLYPPVVYTELPSKLKPIQNVGKWPVYWAYLLGQTLRDAWYKQNVPEEQVELKNVEQYAIAYCHILTGEECIATGSADSTTGDGKGSADDVVLGILGRAQITVSLTCMPLRAFPPVLQRLILAACDCYSNRHTRGRCLAGRYVCERNPNRLGLQGWSTQKHRCVTFFEGRSCQGRGHWRSRTMAKVRAQ
jgi:hypothetical protein